MRRRHLNRTPDLQRSLLYLLGRLDQILQSRLLLWLGGGRVLLDIFVLVIGNISGKSTVTLALEGRFVVAAFELLEIDF